MSQLLPLLCGQVKMSERYERYANALQVAKDHGNKIFAAAIQKEMDAMKKRGEDVAEQNPTDD